MHFTKMGSKSLHTIMSVLLGPKLPAFITPPLDASEVAKLSFENRNEQFLAVTETL